jgi:hypothetical protein
MTEAENLQRKQDMLKLSATVVRSTVQLMRYKFTLIHRALTHAHTHINYLIY